MDLHKLWRIIGSPRSGTINDARIKAKLEYKNAISVASNNSLKNCSNSLSSSLVNNDSQNFWKIWNDKFNSKNMFSGPINGLSQSTDIANAFRDHFSNLL